MTTNDISIKINEVIEEMKLGSIKMIIGLGL